jgi:hypothetical protein
MILFAATVYIKDESLWVDITNSVTDRFEKKMINASRRAYKIGFLKSFVSSA